MDKDQITKIPVSVTANGKEIKRAIEDGLNHPDPNWKQAIMKAFLGRPGTNFMKGENK